MEGGGAEAPAAEQCQLREATLQQQRRIGVGGAQGHTTPGTWSSGPAAASCWLQHRTVNRCQ